MTIRTIDCVDCGESVPYGRLSCPACGALVASVAGGDAPSATVAAYAAPEPAAAADVALTVPGWPPIGAAQTPLAAPPYVTSASAYRPPAPIAPVTAFVAAAPNSGASAPVPAARDASQAGVSDEIRFVEVAGWFVIVGAAMSLLGFLLPWSRVVIGARSVGGYLDTWGLASPTHALVLTAILAVLGLGIVRTPVPAWLRSGVLGLALGSLLIGLTWPYLVGPLGADVGVIVVALGGLALVMGGGVASWATRHAEVEPVV